MLTAKSIVINAYSAENLLKIGLTCGDGPSFDLVHRRGSLSYVELKTVGTLRMLPGCLCGCCQLIGTAVCGKIGTKSVLAIVDFLITIEFLGDRVSTEIVRLQGVRKNIIVLVLFSPMEGICDRIQIFQTLPIAHQQPLLTRGT